MYCSEIICIFCKECILEDSADFEGLKLNHEASRRLKTPIASLFLYLKKEILDNKLIKS